MHLLWNYLFICAFIPGWSEKWDWSYEPVKPCEPDSAVRCVRVSD